MARLEQRFFQTPSAVGSFGGCEVHDLPIAAPAEDVEQVRSGTCSTVRFARNQARPAATAAVTHRSIRLLPISEVKQTEK